MDGAPLRKNSHTARQLYASSPQALFYASRVLLVGRVPPDWLKKSQKGWRAWRSAANRAVTSSANRIDSELVAGFTRVTQRRMRRPRASPADAAFSRRRMRRQRVGVTEDYSAIEGLYPDPELDGPAEAAGSVVDSATAAAAVPPAAIEPEAVPPEPVAPATIAPAAAAPAAAAPALAPTLSPAASHDSFKSARTAPSTSLAAPALPQSPPETPAASPDAAAPARPAMPPLRTRFSELTPPARARRSPHTPVTLASPQQSLPGSRVGSRTLTLHGEAPEPVEPLTAEERPPPPARSHTFSLHSPRPSPHSPGHAASSRVFSDHLRRRDAPSSSLHSPRARADSAASRERSHRPAPPHRTFSSAFSVLSPRVDEDPVELSDEVSSKDTDSEYFDSSSDFDPDEEDAWDDAGPATVIKGRSAAAGAADSSTTAASLAIPDAQEDGEMNDMRAMARQFATAKLAAAQPAPVDSVLDGESFDADAEQGHAAPSAVNAVPLGRRAGARRYLRAFLDRGQNVSSEETHRARRDQRFFHKRRGQVLFVNNCILQVRETKKHVHSGTKITEYEVASSICMERWKEYTVVARYTGRVSAPVTLYFYRTPKYGRLAAKMSHRWSRSLKHKIRLDASYHSGVFSGQDLTVALWSSDKAKRRHERTIFFLFASQSSIQQMSWLYFLNNTIGQGVHPPEMLHIGVPEFGIDVAVPTAKLVEMAARAAEQNLRATGTDAAVAVTYHDVMCPTSTPAQLASDIMNGVWRTLMRIYGENAASRQFLNERKFGLAWRRFDRLKWLPDASNVNLMTSWAMLETHELEFREKFSATRPVFLESGDSMVEPTALEGFCWRLSTWKGTSRRQNLDTRTYLHSHDHLLYYSTPNKVLLPLLSHKGKIFTGENSGEIAAFSAEMPDSQRIEPYALNPKGEVKWLREVETLEDFDEFDAMGVFESDRRMKMITRADGMIDMTDIDSVTPLSKEEFFQISFGREKNVLMRTESRVVRDIWVERLNELVKYWKVRRKTDSERVQKYHRLNGEKFDLTADVTTLAITKWESTSAIVDALTYTPLSMTGGRGILYANFIYKKSSKYNTFKNYFAVLTPQALVLYHVQYRTSQRSIERQQVYFATRRVYELQSCYIYSGTVTTDHLLEGDVYFDQNNPGVQALPRTYLDGWRSSDSEVDRCFVLWTARRYKGYENVPKAKNERRIVCLARSRFERDVWVAALQDAITGLAEGTVPSVEANCG